MTVLSISTASATVTSGTETVASSRSVASSTDLGLMFEVYADAAEARLVVGGVAVPLPPLGPEASFALSAESAANGVALHIGREPSPAYCETLRVSVAGSGPGAVHDDGARASPRICALAECLDPFGIVELELPFPPAGYPDVWG